MRYVLYRLYIEYGGEGTERAGLNLDLLATRLYRNSDGMEIQKYTFKIHLKCLGVHAMHFQRRGNCK